MSDEPQTMTIRVELVFNVDGKPAIYVPQEFTDMPMPSGPPDPERVPTLRLQIDARELLLALEPHLGPTVASLGKPKLLVMKGGA